MAGDVVPLTKLNPAQRKAITGPVLGTGFDPLGDRLFTSFNDSKIFEYGETTARDYREMLERDGKARSLEQALTLPLRSAPWSIVPAHGDKGEAKMVEDILAAMATPIDLVIGQMTSAVVYRKCFFEKQYDVTDGDVVLRKLAYRPPATCQLARDVKDAGFAGFRQNQWWFGQNVGAQSSSLGYVDIPAQRAYVYLHGTHRDPLHGISDLESTYWAYETSQKILFLWFTYLEGQSLPRTVVYGDSEDEAGERAQEYASLKDGGVLGQKRPPDGAKAFEVLESSGKGGDQFVRALDWLDSRKSASVLAGFLDLTSAAASGTGSYALSADQSSLFLASRSAVLREMGTSLTKWVIEPLVIYNRGPGAAIPTLKFGPVKKEAADQAFELLQAVATAPMGQYLPREFINELIVRVAGLLELDTDKVAKAVHEAGQQATQAAQTPAQAEVAPVAGGVDAVEQMLRDTIGADNAAAGVTG